MNFASDVNVYQEWANIVVENKFHAPVERKYFAAYISRKWDKTYIHAHEEIIEKFGEKIVLFTDVPGIFAEVMGNFAYIARAESKDEIYEMIKFIQAKH
jgi:hypothetical protein